MPNITTRGIVVRDRKSWGQIWQRAMASHWIHDEDIELTSEKLAKSLTKQLHICNASYHGADGKASLHPTIPDDIDSIGFKAYAGSDHEVIRIKVAADSTAKPILVFQNAHLPIKAWAGITGTLTIKIPQRDESPDNQLLTLADYTALQVFFLLTQFYLIPTATCKKNKHKGSEWARRLSMNAELGNRGGPEGIDKDFRWLQLAPKKAAYNWSRSDDKIKDRDNFSNYPYMRESLGYTTPAGLTVKVEYAKRNGDGDYTPNSLTNTLELAEPAKPNPGYLPTALTGLNAKRSNQPFTCT